LSFKAHGANPNQRAHIMSIKTHSTVFTLGHDDDETCESIPHGAFTGATSDIMSVSIHDVVSVKRRTRRITGGRKVTTIEIRDARGGWMTLDCFIGEGES
jgi:hypothetical protein